MNFENLNHRTSIAVFIRFIIHLHFLKRKTSENFAKISFQQPNLNPCSFPQTLPGFEPGLWEFTMIEPYQNPMCYHYTIASLAMFSIHYIRCFCEANKGSKHLKTILLLLFLASRTSSQALRGSHRNICFHILSFLRPSPRFGLGCGLGIHIHHIVVSIFLLTSWFRCLLRNYRVNVHGIRVYGSRLRCWRPGVGQYWRLRRNRVWPCTRGWIRNGLVSPRTWIKCPCSQHRHS